MSLRVNTNMPAINSHRNLVNNNTAMGKTMERLSSGLKINRGADGPASLVISERLRAQTAGLSQAIDNSEAGISLLQTAEASLDEVSRALIGARQLAVHAANEAVNDDFMMQADQQEINNILATVNRIAQNTQYGQKNLLDGSQGAAGVVSGQNLEFVSATNATKTSGATGYDVHITQAATRSQVTGTTPLTTSLINKGTQITITEGSKTVNFNTIKGETVEANLNALEKAIKDAGLKLDMVRPDQIETNANQDQYISLRHQEFGSDHTFSVSTSEDGLLDSAADTYRTITNGLDVDGEINGEEAYGVGQVLYGKAGNANTEGLAVRYTGESLPGFPPEANLPANLTPPEQISEQMRAGYKVLTADPDGTAKVAVELATDHEGDLLQNQDGTFRTKDGVSVSLPNLSEMSFYKNFDQAREAVSPAPAAPPAEGEGADAAAAAELPAESAPAGEDAAAPAQEESAAINYDDAGNLQTASGDVKLNRNGVPVSVVAVYETASPYGAENYTVETGIGTTPDTNSTPFTQVKTNSPIAIPSGRVRAGSVTVAQNSLVFQIGANADQTTSISLRNMRTQTLGNGVANESGFKSLADIDVTDADKAQDAIRVLDKALEEVSSTRADMGAFQTNNLESNLNYLRIAHENVTSSESVIRDADMAEEMVAFTRNQIMSDSATAMLAQANQRAMSVLSLIR